MNQLKEEINRKTLSYFDKLPDELVLRILSNLELSFLATKISLASKRFRNLCIDPSLWTKLPDELPESMDIQIKFCIIKRCTQLKDLAMYDKDSLSVAEKSLEYNQKLQVLSIPLSQYESSDSLLEAIAKFGSSSLKTLDLSGYINGMTFAAKASALQNLTELYMNGHEGMSNSAELLEAIGNNCGKLEIFYMTNWATGSSISPEVMDAFFSGSVNNTIKEITLHVKLSGEGSLRSVWKCRLLKTLDMEHSDKRISNVDFLALTQLANLEKLNLADSIVTATSADVIIAFSDRKLSKLRYLNLFDTQQIVDDDILCTIATNCPKLSYLDLSLCESITNVGLKRILQECVKLKSLGVMGNDNVTVDAFRGAKANLKYLMLSSVEGYSKGFQQQKSVEELKRLMPDTILCCDRLYAC